VLDEALDRLLDPLVELVPRGPNSTGPGTDRLPALIEEPGGRGTDVITSVTLGTRDLQIGLRPIVRFTCTEPCTECSGTGFAELPNEECGYCEGAGIVEAERLLGLRIPEEVGDGAELRVRGEGNVPRRGGPPGDLFIHVHVVPREKRPKRNLYTMFAAAVVVLAVLAYLRFFS
jgi:DnaJ-class molecular chaperone